MTDGWGDSSFHQKVGQQDKTEEIGKQKQFLVLSTNFGKNDELLIVLRVPRKS